MRPTPGNQIRELMEGQPGQTFLAELDASHDVLAVDLKAGSFACIWSAPGSGEQTLFAGIDTEKGLTSGMPSQVSLKEVRFEEDETALVVEASSAEEDRDEVSEIFELQPGGLYEVKVKTAELPEVDFIQIWKSGTPLSAKEANSG